MPAEAVCGIENTPEEMLTHSSTTTSAIDARRLKTQDGYAPVPAKPTSLQREVRQNYE